MISVVITSYSKVKKSPISINFLKNGPQGILGYFKSFKGLSLVIEVIKKLEVGMDSQRDNVFLLNLIRSEPISLKSLAFHFILATKDIFFLQQKK